MKERPILFSAPMVRAILAGTKTQTRRVSKAHQSGGRRYFADDMRSVPRLDVSCLYGDPGDRLWVRETWAQNWNQLSDSRMDRSYVYRADGEARAQDNGTELPWRPSIHMPRVACRIVLEVTGVRVERLQDISEEDATAEGARFGYGEPFDPANTISDRRRFELLWEEINGAGSWAENPWVWVVEFRRLGQHDQ